jgi:hypothetical protein
MCTRYILISEEEILRFLEIISKYNSNSKILFITGIEHSYFSSLKNDNIICKYLLNYDPKDFYDFDYTHFRPEFSKYIQSLQLNKI